ncbi:MAG: hypothetical protein NTV80_01120 [Verrucomicrobia bacterium]|nr:hypothetical protein [Verrucomicrobiota bacterium]
MLWINRHIANKSGDRLVRLLELGTKENRASDVLGHVMSSANAWTINQKIMRMPIARARMAVGQKEIAISDAQCFMLAARREGDEASEQQMTGLLTELGAPPLDSLPTPREFVTLPSSCSINLMHDETIAPQHASEVALQIAGFWGCAVKIWPVKMEVKKLASYNRLNQAVDGNDFAKMLSGVTWPQDQTLGTVFLTHHKLISESRGNVGDVYSSHSGVTTVLSDHYFQKYASLDKRPLTVLNAVAAGYLTAVWAALWVEAEKDGDPALSFSPVPPDVFASNGNLIVNDRELGISLRTGALLKRIGSSALIEYVQNRSLFYFKRESERPGPDSALAEAISQQLSRTTPVITKIPESTK